MPDVSITDYFGPYNTFFLSLDSLVSSLVYARVLGTVHRYPHVTVAATTAIARRITFVNTMVRPTATAVQRPGTALSSFHVMHAEIVK